MRKKKINKKQNIKEIVTSNKKLIIGVALGLLISIGTVYGAEILFYTDEVSYDDNKTDVDLGASDLFTAFEKLYEQEQTCNHLQITYDKGNCPIVSNMPEPQSTMRRVETQFPSNIPECSDGRVFLGWSTNRNANESSSWYDPDETYSIDNHLKLYAQWFDVSSLEKWYTTVVQSGDFIRKETAAKHTTESNKAYTSVNLAHPTQSGYTYKAVAGFEAKGYRRIYRLSSAGEMNYRSLAAGSAKQDRMQFLYVKDRTASTSTSDIDTRIDELQKIEEVAIAYDDIKYVQKKADNISITNYESEIFTPDSGYKFVTYAGHSIENASKSGINSSRMAIYRFIVSNDSATVSVMSTVSSLNNKPKIKIYARFVEVKTKDNSNHITYVPNKYSTKGASRYHALKSLSDDKNNYFPAKYIKTTRFDGPNYTLSDFGSGAWKSTVTLPDGKLLGVSNWVISTNDSGSSYSIPWAVNIVPANKTAGELKVYIRCQNSHRSSSAGETCKKVYPIARVLYISSGTADGVDKYTS